MENFYHQSRCRWQAFHALEERSRHRCDLPCPRVAETSEGVVLQPSGKLCGPGAEDEVRWEDVVDELFPETSGEAETING